MSKVWRHQVNPGWLEARRDVLTASEIAGLQAEYKRYAKKPGDVHPGFLALAYEKAATGEVDIDSPSPAAARGHIMEPYAIEEVMHFTGEEWYHWDDVVIKNGGIGCSPDALDFEQEPAMGVELHVKPASGILFSWNKSQWDGPKRILEVKCYNPKAHCKALMTPPKEHDEMLQVAMAMSVMPTLESARIAWYCPDTPVPLYTQLYDRDDLKDKIELVENIAEAYYEQAAKHEGLYKPKQTKTIATTCRYTEEEIWQEYLATLETHSSLAVPTSVR